MAKCVLIRIVINGLEEWALLDSGSQVTCISEELYNQLCSIGKFDELPTSKLYVATAIGKKATTIRKQILIEISMNDNKFLYPFLVVPHLSTNVIFGHDWFVRDDVILNYKTGCFEVRDNLIPRELVLFERDMLDRVVVHKDEEITYVHVMNTEYCNDFNDNNKSGDKDKINNVHVETQKNEVEILPNKNENKKK